MGCSKVDSSYNCDRSLRNESWCTKNENCIAEKQLNIESEIQATCQYVRSLMNQIKITLTTFHRGCRQKVTSWQTAAVAFWRHHQLLFLVKKVIIQRSGNLWRHNSAVKRWNQQTLDHWTHNVVPMVGLLAHNVGSPSPVFRGTVFVQRSMFI